MSSVFFFIFGFPRQFAAVANTRLGFQPVLLEKPNSSTSVNILRTLEIETTTSACIKKWSFSQLGRTLGKMLRDIETEKIHFADLAGVPRTRREQDNFYNFFK